MARWDILCGIRRIFYPAVVETVDQVIVFIRRDDEKVNQIFPGNYAGIQKSDLPHRYSIHFSGLKEVVTTESNWPELSKSGQNPVS
jgi:hypothetical protein